MKHHKNSLLITAILIGIVTSIASIDPPQQRKFKNLKVLPKNISEEELDKEMDKYCKALGVKCNFCHVKGEGAHNWNMASDAKPEKLICRKMINMTTDINKKYFGIKKKGHVSESVTCITCHRGKPRPEMDSSMLTKNF